jgi:hypothetical protein
MMVDRCDEIERLVKRLQELGYHLDCEQTIVGRAMLRRALGHIGRRDRGDLSRAGLRALDRKIRLAVEEFERFAGVTVQC